LGGSEDAFVVKFSPTGALRYSTYLGGREGDQGGGIAVDRQGQAYVTGGTVSSDFPIVNPLQADVSGNGSAFVAKFSDDGLTLRYSTYLGGKEGSGGGKIAVDRKGQAYVTGTTQSTDFPTANALQPTLGGGVDAFVAKIGSNDQP
jgi:hypothetical protein